MHFSSWDSQRMNKSEILTRVAAHLLLTISPVTSSLWRFSDEPPAALAFAASATEAVTVVEASGACEVILLLDAGRDCSNVEW